MTLFNLCECVRWRVQLYIRGGQRFEAGRIDSPRWHQDRGISIYRSQRENHIRQVYGRKRWIQGMHWFQLCLVSTVFNERRDYF